MAEQPGRPQQPVPPEKDARKVEEPKNGPGKPPAAQEKGAEKIAKPENPFAPGKGTDTVRVRIVGGDLGSEGETIGKRVETLEKANEKIATLEKRVVDRANERIATLEKRIVELERLRNRGKWVAGCAAVAVACAAVALYYVASLPATPPPPKNLDVEGLVVRDANHRFRAEIGQVGSDWGLYLTDEKSIGSEANKHGEIPRIELRVSEKGENRLIIRGAGKRQSAVDLGINDLGWPCVSLFDKDTGARRADLGETEVADQGKLEKRSAASVVLRDNQGNLLWKAGDAATDFAPVTPPPLPAK